MQMKGYAGNKSFIKPSDIQVGDSVLVRQDTSKKATTAYETEALQVQYREGTGVVAKWPDGSSITRTTAHFKKVPFRSSEEAHKWSSAECSADPVSESPPSTREDGPPSLEHTDGTMVGVGTNEFIPGDLALPVGLTAPLALDQGPGRSKRH